MGGDPFFDVPNNLISDNAKQAKVLAERHGCPIELDNVAYAYVPYYAEYGIGSDPLTHRDVLMICDGMDLDDARYFTDGDGDDDGEYDVCHDTGFHVVVRP